MSIGILTGFPQSACYYSGQKPPADARLHQKVSYVFLKASQAVGLLWQLVTEIVLVNPCNDSEPNRTMGQDRCSSRANYGRLCIWSGPAWRTRTWGETGSGWVSGVFGTSTQPPSSFSLPCVRAATWGYRGRFRSVFGESHHAMLLGPRPGCNHWTLVCNVVELTE